MRRTEKHAADLIDTEAACGRTSAGLPPYAQCIIDSSSTKNSPAVLNYEPRGVHEAGKTWAS